MVEAAIYVLVMMHYSMDQHRLEMTHVADFSNKEFCRKEAESRTPLVGTSFVCLTPNNLRTLEARYGVKMREKQSGL